MKAQTIDTKESTGRFLSSSIFGLGGKNLMTKGHLLGENDIRLLELNGIERISVTQLEEGEISDEEAVCAIGGEIACGVCQVRLAPDGRANLMATEDSCVLVDCELLRQVNCSPDVAIATTFNFSFARAGQRIATIKSAPFAVSKSNCDRLVGMLQARGPIIQARPTRGATTAVLFCDPLNGDHARAHFESVLRQKLEGFEIRSHASLAVPENEECVSRGMLHLFRAKPSVVLVASTTAAAGPSDAVGAAMEKIGCQIEHFLAPVEPGSLFLLGYKEDIPIMSAPGCFRSLKPNVIDLMLPPMLARYRVSAREVASLGHGGLLN
jgi:molybdenum cofactor cytidylyltransferase